MKKTTNLILLTIILTCIIFFMSGCMKLRVNLSLNRDGSGDIEYILATPPSIYHLISENPEELRKIKKTAKKTGYTISDFKSNEYLGIRLKQSFNDITKIKNPVILIEAFKKNYANDKFHPDNLTTPDIDIKRSFVYTYYTYQQELDLSNYTGKENKIPGITPSVLNKIDLGMKLTLPVKILEHNADLVKNQGKTLVWNFIPAKKQRIYLKVAVLNTVNIISTAIASLIVLFIGILVFMKKGRVK